MFLRWCLFSLFSHCRMDIAAVPCYISSGIVSFEPGYLAPAIASSWILLEFPSSKFVKKRKLRFFFCIMTKLHWVIPYPPMNFSPAFPPLLSLVLKSLHTTLYMDMIMKADLDFSYSGDIYFDDFIILLESNRTWRTLTCGEWKRWEITSDDYRPVPFTHISSPASREAAFTFLQIAFWRVW